MTQQEQHQTYVPGQRDGEQEEHAVGTAHTPHEEHDERGEEAYPAATYASGSADPDAADRDDVEVVDRDEALAEEEREDDPRDADEGEVDAAYDNAVREDEVRDTEAEADEPEASRADETSEADETSQADEAFQSDEADEAFQSDEVDDVDAADDAEAPQAVEDERDEDEIANAEAQEDRQWAAEHATELRAGSTNLDDDEPAVDAGPVATGESTDEAYGEPAVVAEPVATEEATGEDEDRAESPADAMPGSVDVTAVGAIWAGGAADGLRERWRELQLRFIDEPRSVADAADALVGEAVDTITNSLQAQRRELAAWQNEPGDDTERLRAAVRGYRDYLDRLLGM